MNIVTNEIVIHADAAAVWKACTHVERWAEVFDTVKSISARVLPDDEVLFEMSVENGMGQNVVRSRRRHHHEALRIDFTLLAAPSPITTMDGWWIVNAEGSDARLSIVHRFEVADPAVPTANVERSIHENTEHVLRRLRAWVERQPRETARDAGAS